MVSINTLLIIVLFMIVLILLYYNWRITNSVYDLEDELNEKFDNVLKCLEEIALACDNNTEFIDNLCNELVEELDQDENIQEN